MHVRHIKRLVFVSTGILALSIVGCKPNAQAQNQNTEASSPPVVEVKKTKADVPFVPTPNEVVEQMLKMANVSNGDIVFDLGSGDGRIPITAVQRYAAKRAVGVEINPDLVKQSRENAEKAGVSDRVKFLQQDLFKTDLRDANVVTLYLLPDVNLKLRPKLFEELKPGTRVVSHAFNMGDWKPEREEQVKANNGRTYTLYQWTIPENIPNNLRSSRK